MKIIACLFVAALFLAAATVPAVAYSTTYCEIAFNPSDCGGDISCEQLITQEQVTCISTTSLTMTFDGYDDGTVLSHVSSGIWMSGASVTTTCAIGSFPPVSGTNVATSQTGLMTFNFDPAVFGNVQTISAYVTDYTEPAGIYAYDASNHLLGQAVMSSAGVNTFLSLTVQNIAYVTVNGSGGGPIAVDNVSLAWSPITTPTYSCTGFQSPFNVSLMLAKKTNRAIPLKLQLFDGSNNLVTPATLGTAASPVVNVSYSSGASNAIDESALLNPLGQSSSGNQFSFDPTTQIWWFNLATTNFSAQGTYTVTLQSGDTSKYQVSPQCSGTFVRQ